MSMAPANHPRDDSDRRELVRNLVAAARQQAGSDATIDGEPPRWGAAARSIELPGYEILREIHRGGQGVVYQALQHSTRRKVAIKVMKEGPFAGPADRMRFDREAQILGTLNHPHIVAIHDTGSASGSYYFVMDYVSGEPLDVYMANATRGIDECLHLFRKICEAVQAAHLRGVIHRDLKPGNIRVDHNGDPHILDFGLAKPVSGGSSSAEAMTMTGQFVGSLPWASPEQVEGLPSQIDLRTDVYSLGVILYQMLTTRFPYEVTGPMRDVMERILRSEPVKPRSIRAEIDDEVETIVLKCLHKDRDHRYQTAGEVGRDVAHYLADEPIEAKRDSGWYVMRKTLRRYRAVAAVVVAFVVVLTASTAALWVMYRGQSEARRDADAQRDRAIAAVDSEKQQRERADHERDTAVQAREAESLARKRADAVNDFVTKALIGADPNQRGSNEFKVTEAMEQALAQLDAGELIDQPETEASLRLTIARILNGNARSAAALSCAQKALRIRESLYSDDSAERAEALQLVGLCLDSLGRRTEALQSLEEALAIRQRLYPGNHLDVAVSLNAVGYTLNGMGRAEEALARFIESLNMRRRLVSGDDAGVANSLNNVAAALEALGRSGEALPLFQEALQIRTNLYHQDHPDIAAAYNNIAACLESLGRLEDTLSMYESALAMLQRMFPGGHPNIVATLINIVSSNTALGRPTDALPKATAALEMAQRLYPGDHPLVAMALGRHAVCLSALGRDNEALPEHEAALAMLRRLYVGDHPDIADTLSGMAACLAALGRPTDALPSYAAALEMQQRLHPGDHALVAKDLNNLAYCLDLLNRPAEALLKYQAALDIERRLCKGDHPVVAQCLSNVASSLYSLDRASEAEPLFRESLDMLRRVLPADHPNILYPMYGLANSLAKLGRFEEAKELLLEAAAQCERSPETHAVHWNNVVVSMVSFYTHWHTTEPDKGHDIDAAAWRVRMRPPASSASQP